MKNDLSPTPDAPWGWAISRKGVRYKLPRPHTEAEKEAVRKVMHEELLTSVSASNFGIEAFPTGRSKPSSLAELMLPSGSCSWLKMNCGQFRGLAKFRWPRSCAIARSSNGEFAEAAYPTNQVERRTIAIAEVSPDPRFFGRGRLYKHINHAVTVHHSVPT